MEYDISKNGFYPILLKQHCSICSSQQILHPYVLLQGLCLLAQRQECRVDTRRQASAPAEMQGGVVGAQQPSYRMAICCFVKAGTGEALADLQQVSAQPVMLREGGTST